MHANEFGHLPSDPRFRLIEPLAQLGSTLFHLSHQGHNDIGLMRLLSAAVRAMAPTLEHTAPHCALPPPMPPSPHSLPVLASPDGGSGSGGPRLRPIRVGLLSVHLRDHSIGRIFAELLAMLSDRHGVSPAAHPADGAAAAPAWTTRPITLHIFEPRSVAVGDAAAIDCEDAQAGGDSVSR